MFSSRVYVPKGMWNEYISLCILLTCCKFSQGVFHESMMTAGSVRYDDLKIKRAPGELTDFSRFWKNIKTNKGVCV